MPLFHVLLSVSLAACGAGPIRRGMCAVQLEGQLEVVCADEGSTPTCAQYAVLSCGVLRENKRCLCRRR